MRPQRVRESAAAEAEDVRLAYVACTRAKDHLLVSLFRPEAKKDTTRAAKLEEFCADHLDLFQKLDWESLVEAAAAYTPQAEEEERLRLVAILPPCGRSGRRSVISTIEKASRPQAQAVTAIAQRVKGQPPSVPAEGDVIIGEGGSRRRRNPVPARAWRDEPWAGGPRRAAEHRPAYRRGAGGHLPCPSGGGGHRRRSEGCP